jgi:hypothetical protein
MATKSLKYARIARANDVLLHAGLGHRHDLRFHRYVERFEHRSQVACGFVRLENHRTFLEFDVQRGYAVLRRPLVLNRGMVRRPVEDAAEFLADRGRGDHERHRGETQDSPA